MDIAARVERLIADAVGSFGLELVHVEYQPRRDSSVLKIYIDKPGGVTVDDCQRVSRHVGVVLDVEDPIPHRYTLEVSSPGIERPLFKPEDYSRFSGKEVRLTTVEKIEGRKNFVGYLRGIEEGVVEFESEGKTIKVPLRSIRKANLVYRFDNSNADDKSAK